MDEYEVAAALELTKLAVQPGLSDKQLLVEDEIQGVYGRMRQYIRKSEEFYISSDYDNLMDALDAVRAAQGALWPGQSETLRYHYQEGTRKPINDWDDDDYELLVSGEDKQMKAQDLRDAVHYALDAKAEGRE